MRDPLQQYPFERVWVDHLVHGSTRVWWRHHANFRPSGSLAYQLQRGQTGSASAADWTNVGDPVTNASVLTDDNSRLQGKKARLHYRILVSNAAGQPVGVSLPVGVWGLLDDKAWLVAREVLRQYEISHRLSTRHGFLLKRMRTGQVDQNAVNPLTGAILDSRRTQTMGTEFEIGYHPPIPTVCMDLSPQDIEEDRADDLRGPVRDTAMVVGYTPAFPQLDFEDVWVDGRSDDRWSVVKVKNEIELRGVPLINQVVLALLPKTDIAYKIPVDEHALSQPLLTRRGPTQLANPVTINHNFGGIDALTYTDSTGHGIIGAKILLLRKTDYDNGLRKEVSAIAVSQTGAAGRWMADMVVDPGLYVLIFEKPGEFGPNSVELIVHPPQ